MRIAVINEVSACSKNADIVNALKEQGHEVLNLGMKEPSQQPSLTYLHTGLMSALVLSLGIADFVVGGCGTGQGYLNSVLQYPGVVCGLLLEPLDAWLFTRINDGNCVSLALNKGYGWAGDLNLKMLFSQLFPAKKEGGYPPARAESQSESRMKLHSLSTAAHLPMEQILKALDPELVAAVFQSKDFVEALSEATKPGDLLDMARELAQKYNYQG